MEHIRREWRFLGLSILLAVTHRDMQVGRHQISIQRWYSPNPVNKVMKFEDEKYLCLLTLMDPPASVPTKTSS